jgi:hypothetical protein
MIFSIKVDGEDYYINELETELMRWSAIRHWYTLAVSTKANWLSLGGMAWC